jgi:two-component system, NtrC family, sensor kinase
MATTPILIIDDEPGVLEGLRDFLEDEGYEVHEAMEAKEGLKVFQSVKPNLVLTDLRMPGMSGMELIGEIRKINTTTPIIVLTGYGTLESAIDAIRLNVFDFITKPIELDFLKTTLEKAKSTVIKAEAIEREMSALREQLELFQEQWREQLSRFSEVEPLIHTGRLLAGILHNLNNPLTYIMGQAELLKILHPEVDNIDVISQQAARMKRIMSTITKKMKESQTRESSWLQFNELLKEEMFFLESHPYYKLQIDTEWRLSQDLPPFEGVASEFSQIFGNLLRNAAEAMSGQSAKRLRISTWHDEKFIYVSISDNGPGISAHLLGRVFQPFFSTKASGTGMAGGMGMGIGLYHCRELIHQYGGQIEAVSKPGEGATFTLILPICECERSCH